jgi:hypothetical protein
MNITQIESNVQGVVKSFNKDSFIYDLLLAYGQPKSSIKRLQQGGLNLSKAQDEILWKKKLYFKSVNDQDLHSTIDSGMIHTSLLLLIFLIGCLFEILHKGSGS